MSTSKNKRKKSLVGWINWKTEIPKKVTERSEIIFGSYKWSQDDIKVRITIEELND